MKLSHQSIVKITARVTRKACRWRILCLWAHMMQKTLTFCSRSCVKHKSTQTQMWWKGHSRQPRGQVRMIICFWGHASLYKTSLCLNGRVKMSSVSAVKQPLPFCAGCQEIKHEMLESSPRPKQARTHSFPPLWQWNDSASCQLSRSDWTPSVEWQGSLFLCRRKGFAFSKASGCQRATSESGLYGSTLCE